MTIDSIELIKLIKSHNKIKSGSSSVISKQLLENKDSVYQLLLPDIKNQVVLYYGNSLNNLLTNLAKKCKKVIAIYRSEKEIEFITQKNNLVAPEVTNIEYLLYQEDIISQLNIGEVNGVIIENNFDSTSILQNDLSFEISKGFLKSLVRKIPENIWIFIKTDGLGDRKILHIGQYNKFISSFKFLCTYNRLLLSSGYIRNRYYGFDNIVTSIFNIVDMSSRVQVNQLAIKKRNWLKFFPYRLNRLILHAVGAFYSTKAKSLSVLEKILSKVKEELSVGSYEVTSIEVNDKNKCVLYIELTGCKYKKIVVKIGLDEISTGHLIHHFNGLVLLNHELEKDNTQSRYFPTPIYQGECDGVEFIVESFLPGLPWRDISSPTSNPLLIIKTINVIKSICSLEEGAFGGKIKGGGLLERINYVIDFVVQLDQKLGRSFAEYLSPILQKENTTRKKYFYKSDFTVSNILLSEKGELKIIDLDFWGLSSNKLLDFADFIISYSRCFYQRDINYCINAIINLDLAAFPKELNLKNNLELMESDVATLKDAMILSWLNSIYHIIEFDITRSNRSHMETLLYIPLKNMLHLHQQ